MRSEELDNKIKNLLNYIENNKNDLAKLIEAHSSLFPTIEDTLHTNKLEEHWNDKAYGIKTSADDITENASDE